MADFHIDLHAPAPSVRWAATDDDAFDAERIERELLERRRQLFAELADLDAA